MFHRFIMLCSYIPKSLRCPNVFEVFKVPNICEICNVCKVFDVLQFNSFEMCFGSCMLFSEVLRSLRFSSPSNLLWCLGSLGYLGSPR